MSIQGNSYRNECNDKVRTSKKSERKSIKQSIVREESLKMKNGWVEPAMGEKPRNKKMSSFIEKKVRSAKKGEQNCDNGAFSLWRMSRAA